MATLGDHLTDDEADDMMKDADTNGDGKVDYQEFSRMVKQKQWFWDSDLYITLLRWAIQASSTYIHQGYDAKHK